MLTSSSGVSARPSFVEAKMKYTATARVRVTMSPRFSIVITGIAGVVGVDEEQGIHTPNRATSG